MQLFAGRVEIAKTKSFVHRLKIGFILTDINKFIEIALKHVPFEGWNEQVFEKTCLEANISIIQGKLLFPRSSTDLMLSFLKRDDEKLSSLIKKSDNVNQKYRNRISNAIFDRINLAQQNREAYRKALSLLALPHMAPDNAAMMWNLSDTIWIALNDSSTDINWYTKRITLGFVYSTSLIYWLGDESHELKKTKDFLERRIEDVMEFEKVKGKFRNSKFGQEFMRGPGKVFSFIKAPNVEQK
ncbi:MAG: COQ9 family protein [Rhodobacteraceae bacterium]|nr:COQ9 family protein [Paracoccaceae bacterium]